MNTPDEDAGVGGSGYDLDELSAYADRGRAPAIAAIDENPECQAVLDGIDRLGALSRRMIAAETRRAAPSDDWVRSLLQTISREARSGRDVPFPPTDPHVSIAMTEGAVRELVRAAGDSVPGVLIGRVSLDWRDDPADATVGVTLAASLERPLLETAALVREAVAEALRRTPFRPRALDVTVDDVLLPDGPAPAGEVDR